MIDPTLATSPAQSVVIGPTTDALNGAYSGIGLGADPSSASPIPSYLGNVGAPFQGDGPSVVSPAQVSPQIFGVGAPVSIMGTPGSFGSGSALTGSSVSGDAGVLSGMGVGQVMSSDSGAPAPAAPGDSAPPGGS